MTLKDPGTLELDPGDSEDRFLLFMSSLSFFVKTKKLYRRCRRVKFCNRTLSGYQNFRLRRAAAWGAQPSPDPFPPWWGLRPPQTPPAASQRPPKGGLQP